MACKKYLIYNSVEEIAVNNLYKFLERYAVPDYFSKVEYDSEALTVTCYNVINDNETEAMIIDRPKGYNRVTIYTNSASGERVSVTHSSSSSSSKAKYLVAGYVTDNGIAISAGAEDNTIEGTMIAMITKDTDGRTAIITGATTFSYVSSVEEIIACNGYYYSPVCNCRTTIVRSIVATTLCPILMPDYNGGYTPNVYVMPFAENRSVGILELNGKRYLSNGVICMKCDNEEETA